jgi:hypothetical protein
MLSDGNYLFIYNSARHYNASANGLQALGSLFLFTPPPPPLLVI